MTMMLGSCGHSGTWWKRWFGSSCERWGNQRGNGRGYCSGGFPGNPIPKHDDSLGSSGTCDGCSRGRFSFAVVAGRIDLRSGHLCPPPPGSVHTGGHLDAELRLQNVEHWVGATLPCGCPGGGGGGGSGRRTTPPPPLPSQQKQRSVIGIIWLASRAC